MSVLTIVTYNVYRERKGRDPALDALLHETDSGRTILCLQEVRERRAWEILRRFGRRAFLSPAAHGYHFLVTVLPEEFSVRERRTVQLNSFGGLLPDARALSRGYLLLRAGKPARDSITPRAVQMMRVGWRERAFWLFNAHLPYEAVLRDRCLARLADLVAATSGPDNAVLAGDLNAVTEDVFLKDLLLATGMRAVGNEEPTHDSRRRIDYVLVRGVFREAGYSLERSMSDHLAVRVELEV